MHGAVGGATGWMGDFTGAPLDPIFWLHHCNIDRLWRVWTSQTNPERDEPTAAAWRNTKFAFNDATGKVVQLAPADVIDPNALGYDYDDISVPITKKAGVPFAFGATPKKTPNVSASKKKPELAGATSTSVVLKGATTHKAFAVAPPPAPTAKKAAAKRGAAAAAGAEAVLPRAFLNLENITSRDRSHAYDVYLNVPDGDEPEQHPELRVGRLPLFGVVEASRKLGAHAGEGLHHVFEITKLYYFLSGLPGWNPKKLRVSFVPTRDQDTAAKVTVGRVSLYVQT
jgi:tyrosinase